MTDETATEGQSADALKEALRRAEAERLLLSRRLEEALNELNAMRVAFEEPQSSAAEIYTRLQTIESSTSWKLIALAQGMLGQLPDGVRKAALLVVSIVRRLLSHRRSSSATASTPPAPELGSVLKLPLTFRPTPVITDARIAVIIHMFHPELAYEFRTRLEALPTPSDVFISVPSADAEKAVRRSFESWGKGQVDIRVTPNRGRDIAQKLVTFRDVYQRYDYVLFLHSKKSPHSSNLHYWRHFLIDNLVGDWALTTNIIDIFAAHPHVGMIAARHFESIRAGITWGENFALAEQIARHMGVVIHETDDVDFPSGSMFWARSTALAPLLDLNLTFDDFGEETGQIDGTLAHAIERLFFLSCEKAGLTWLKVARLPPYGGRPRLAEVHDDDELNALISRSRLLLKTGAAHS